MSELVDEISLNQLKELESSLNYGLTLFEVLRKPRIVKFSEYEGVKTSLNNSGLRDEISCAICSGIVTKCMILKTCLHRFCSSCIEKCFRIGLHECPKCRKHIPSRRFLRADPIYDSIISRIVTNVQVFEELNDTFMVAINKGIPNDPIIQAIRSNYLNENPKIRIDDVKCGDFSIESKFDDKVFIKEVKKRREVLRSTLPKSPDFTQLLFRIISDDTLPQIFPKGLRFDGDITVYHLLMYIKTSLLMSQNSEIRIYLKDPEYVPPPNVTLAFLRNIRCIQSHEILNIYYGSTHLKL